MRRPTHIPAADDNALLPGHAVVSRDALNCAGEGAHELRRLIVGLDVEEEPDLPPAALGVGEPGEKIDQARHGLVRGLEGAQVTEVGPGALGDGDVDAVAALEGAVVGQDDVSVGGEMEIRLEGVSAGGDGRAEGEHGVFGVEGLVAAVGDGLGDADTRG